MLDGDGEDVEGMFCEMNEGEVIGDDVLGEIGSFGVGELDGGLEGGCGDAALFRGWLAYRGLGGNGKVLGWLVLVSHFDLDPVAV